MHNSNAIIPIDTQTNAPDGIHPAGRGAGEFHGDDARGRSRFPGHRLRQRYYRTQRRRLLGLVPIDPTVTTVAAPNPTIPGTALVTDGNHVVVSNPAANQIFIATSVPGIEAIPGISIASFIAATGATEIGNTVTITTNTPHGLVTGQSVLVAGVGVAGYNGVYQVTVPAGTFAHYFHLHRPQPTGFGGVRRRLRHGRRGGGDHPRRLENLYRYWRQAVYLPSRLPLQNHTLERHHQPQPIAGGGFLRHRSPRLTRLIPPATIVVTCQGRGLKAPPVAVGHPPGPTQIAAVPNSGLFPLSTLIPAMVDATLPNIDEVDVDVKRFPA